MKIEGSQKREWKYACGQRSAFRQVWRAWSCYWSQIYLPLNIEEKKNETHTHTHTHKLKTEKNTVWHCEKTRAFNFKLISLKLLHNIKRLLVLEECSIFGSSGPLMRVPELWAHDNKKSPYFPCVYLIHFFLGLLRNYNDKRIFTDNNSNWKFERKKKKKKKKRLRFMIFFFFFFFVGKILSCESSLILTC